MKKMHYPSLGDMEKALVLHFLKEWLSWSYDTSHRIKFKEGDGLCINFENFYVSPPAYSLDKMFFEDRLDPEYPFGDENYHNQKLLKTMHLCPLRRDWVKSAIIKLEEDLTLS